MVVAGQTEPAAVAAAWGAAVHMEVAALRIPAVAQEEFVVVAVVRRLAVAHTVAAAAALEADHTHHHH